MDPKTKLARVWHGPFRVAGPLQSPVSAGDVALKLLEVLWKAGLLLAFAVPTIAAGTTWWDYASSPERLYERVSIMARYSPETCRAHPDTPVVIDITNGSSHRLTRYAWNVSAYQPGRSTNVAEREPNDHAYSSDHIIEPGQSAQFCSKLPTFNVPVSNPSELRFSAYLARYSSFAR